MSTMACCHIALQCPLNEPGSGRFLSPSFRLDDNGILWAATGGGVIAWDLASGDAYGYTVLDGLPANDVHTVVVCPIPEPSIIVGTDEGMALYDPASDMWDRWTEVAVSKTALPEIRWRLAEPPYPKKCPVAKPTLGRGLVVQGWLPTNFQT